MEPYIGQIMLVGFNFQPRGWAFCDGRLQSIAQNTALFSLLGTTYGGDGITTFALPDLRGRVALGMGQGPGLSNVEQGEMAGVENVTLTIGQIPAHNHSVAANSGAGNSNSPSGSVLAGYGTSAPPEGPYSSSSPNTTLAGNSVGATGGSQPHENRQPYLGCNYIIALEGIFPSRS